MERDLADYAAKVLERRGVRIHTSTDAKRIEPERVELSDGTVIDAGTIVLSAGVAPNPMLATFPLEKDRKGRIATDGTMRTKSRPEVWAIGDCASIPDPDGKPYPQLAQHALREARVLAKNITAVLRGGELQPFVYKTLGTLASLGNFQGVGRVMKIKVRGFLAWWVWRSYYLMQMPRFERKLRIVLDWTVALFFRHDIAKLDLFGDQHPVRGRPRTVTTVNGDSPSRTRSALRAINKIHHGGTEARRHAELPAARGNEMARDREESNVALTVAVIRSAVRGRLRVPCLRGEHFCKNVESRSTSRKQEL